MARIGGEIMIRRPIDEVFDFVADERNEPRYNHQMTAAELLTPEPIGPGSRFHAELRMRGRPIDLTREPQRTMRVELTCVLAFRRAGDAVSPAAPSEAAASRRINHRVIAQTGG